MGKKRFITVDDEGSKRGGKKRCSGVEEDYRSSSIFDIPFSRPEWYVSQKYCPNKPTIIAVDILPASVGGAEAEAGAEDNKSRSSRRCNPNNYPKISWSLQPHSEAPRHMVKGQIYDVAKLLSSDTRDYLIKFDQQQVIKIDQLKGKYVVLYMLSVSVDDLSYFYDLLEVYYDLYPKGQFEVVFVALDNNEEEFESLFSKMPWLAIPYHDYETRRRVRIETNISSYSHAGSFVFAPNGELLELMTDFYFHYYGSEGFPFTQERVNLQIRNEDNALLKKFYLKQLTLSQLLGDHVTSCDGKEISTSLLQDKTVALYFFKYTIDSIERTRQLVKMWEELKYRQGVDLEVVVIHLPSTSMPFDYTKTEFMQEFGNMPWYSLPRLGRKLRRIFRTGEVYDPDQRSCDTGYLIIVQPDEPPQTLNYFALEIYQEFGIDAYPFTLEKVVMLQKSKLEETPFLGKLLSPFATLRKECSSYNWDVTLSSLCGKRIMLLFATHSCYESGKFMQELKRMYSQMDSQEDPFEIIYISLDRSLSSFVKCVQNMPWLVHSFAPEFAASLAKLIFFPGSISVPAIAAFGPNGNIVGKESGLAFKHNWSCKYPFIKPYSVEEVVRTKLIIKYGWDLERIFPGISSWK